MAKKQENPTPAAGEVAFDFSAGEIREEEVKAPGVKPFRITFRVPGAAGRVDIALAAAVGGGAEGLASRGEAMVQFIAQHLVSWTLPQPAELKSIAAIRSPTVLFALFSAIHSAGEQRKN